MITNREMRLARVFAVVLMLFAVAEASRAATSADVEREIAGAFERSEFSAAERWAARRPGWRMEWFAYVRGALSARQAWSNYRTEC